MVTYVLHLHLVGKLVGKSVVDFLFDIIEPVSLSYGRDVISGNLSKSAHFEGGGSL